MSRPTARAPGSTREGDRSVPQEIGAATAPEHRLDFLWDYDLNEQQLRAILSDGKPADRRWLLERLLSHASWADIQRFVTPALLRESLPALKLRRGVRETWLRALDLWETPCGSETPEMPDPTAPYLHLLSPLQRRVLDALYETYPEMGLFFLTGGTALSAYYLGHRRSDDLDFFTTDPDVLKAVPAMVQDLLSTCSLTLDRSRQLTFTHQF